MHILPLPPKPPNCRCTDIPAWPAGEMPPLPAASYYLEAIDNELARADSPDVVNALLDRRLQVMGCK